jgi:ABC-type nitrate/sulfonate/bicarbonate transport system substrate-binding protein
MHNDRSYLAADDADLISRREFWIKSARVAGAIAVVGGAGSLLAACGTDSKSGSSSSSDGEIISPRFASSTSVIPIFVQQAAGPLLYGKEFGLNVPSKNYQVFQSHSVAIQTVLSKDADIVAGSVFGSMAGASQGIPLRLFSTARTRDDNVLAGLGKATTFDSIYNDGVRVATDSKGGTAYAELQGMILTSGRTDIVVGSLPGHTVLESSGQRQAALAAGQVDAAVIHIDQFWQVQKVKPEAKMLARSVDTPVFPLTGYAALNPWLDKNQATATAIVKSIAACTKAFADDFQEYSAAVKHLIDQPPSDTDLKRLWQFAVENKIWPIDGTLPQSSYEVAAKLAVESDIFIKAPSYAKAVDSRPGKAA